MLNSIEDFNFLSFDLLSWHHAKHFEVSCSASEFSTSLETRNTSKKNNDMQQIRLLCKI